MKIHVLISDGKPVHLREVKCPGIIQGASEQVTVIEFSPMGEMYVRTWFVLKTEEELGTVYYVQEPGSLGYKAFQPLEVPNPLDIVLIGVGDDVFRAQHTPNSISALPAAVGSRGQVLFFDRHGFGTRAATVFQFADGLICLTVDGGGPFVYEKFE
jgi:hypothetical protein